jgi:hypothetical protein
MAQRNKGNEKFIDI